MNPSLNYVKDTEEFYYNKDIYCRYLKQNARKSSAVSNMTAAARSNLQTWLQADDRLYTHFLKKLNILIDR